MTLQQVMDLCQSNKDFYQNVCTADFWKKWWQRHPRSYHKRGNVLNTMLSRTANDKYNKALFNGILESYCCIENATITSAIENNHRLALIRFAEIGIDFGGPQYINNLGIENLKMLAPWMEAERVAIRYKGIVCTQGITAEQIMHIAKAFLRVKPSLIEQQQFNTANILCFQTAFGNADQENQQIEIIKIMYAYNILAINWIRPRTAYYNAVLAKLEEFRPHLGEEEFWRIKREMTGETNDAERKRMIRLIVDIRAVERITPALMSKSTPELKKILFTKMRKEFISHGTIDDWTIPNLLSEADDLVDVIHTSDQRLGNVLITMNELGPNPTWKQFRHKFKKNYGSAYYKKNKWQIVNEFEKITGKLVK
jgi:hypothetical protein